MSNYNTFDIALWEAENKMSCIYCTNYQGRDEPCIKGVTVKTLNESIDCEYYFPEKCNHADVSSGNLSDLSSDLSLCDGFLPVPCKRCYRL